MATTHDRPPAREAPPPDAPYQNADGPQWCAPAPPAGSAGNGAATTARPRQVAVPERPRLAPGVRLAGQMKESAFKDPPWLLEREGAGYVQVTELLYRIAEQLDGQKTLAQVAEAVSEKTGRGVSADNVKLLVGSQLLLKGLVPTADGKVVAGGSGARSLLALSFRTRMIEPELLEAPSRVLQWLFWPPVLTSLLVAAFVGIGWIVVFHGLAAGARQVLYTPALLLIALALTALAAGFHELGHAAALSYGGGKTRGMGVGLYLVYPAFYTDVSDNYRLGRWGRVRTDLGGIVFHLAFVLGIIGLFLLTGWELLLVAVPLLLVDAFRQLLPFIRLDGYWTLADLTGVPDFLSYVGAFARRILPGQHDQDSKLPELKWWGTLAFSLYILLVLPVLGFMLFTTVRTTPTILATGWDSAGKQLGMLQQASASGSGLGVAAATAQLLILALPTLGAVYSLSRFGRRIGTTVWNWSKPTPTRRVTGALGTLGVLGLIGYLWAPQLPFGRGEPGPLYRPTLASFAPIPADARGTVFDAVGMEQPTWALPESPTVPEPVASPSPRPVLPASEATPPAAATQPIAVPTSVPTSAPTSAPSAPTAGIRATVGANPAVAPTVGAPTVGAPTVGTPTVGAPTPPPPPTPASRGSAPAPAPTAAPPGPTLRTTLPNPPTPAPTIAPNSGATRAPTPAPAAPGAAAPTPTPRP